MTGEPAFETETPRCDDEATGNMKGEKWSSGGPRLAAGPSRGGGKHNRNNSSVVGNKPTEM